MGVAGRAVVVGRWMFGWISLVRQQQLSNRPQQNIQSLQRYQISLPWSMHLLPSCLHLTKLLQIPLYGARCSTETYTRGAIEFHAFVPLLFVFHYI
jgi:hypothetical protein